MMMAEQSEEWEKQVFKLPEQHGWTAKPGNVVFVADRGAVRFEVPQSWHVEPSRTSVKFYDAKPPDDNIGLEMSVIYLAAYGANVDWSSLSIHGMIKDVASGDFGDDGKVGAPLTIKLNGLEIAWVEREFTDPGEKRLAYSRICTARHIESAIQVIITMAFWPEDAPEAKAVWNDVLGTLKLGEYIESPFHGPGAKS